MMNRNKNLNEETDFSRKLHELLNQNKSKFTLEELATKIGINRPSLSKYRKGLGKPKKEDFPQFLENLSSALNLSKFDKDKLSEYYYKLKLGNEKIQKMNKIADLLNNFSNSEYVYESVKNEDKINNENSKIKLINDENDIKTELLNILNNEVNCDNPQISFFIDDHFPVFFDILDDFMLKKAIKVRQIICLKNSSSPNNRYLISKIIPYIYSKNDLYNNRSYDTFYFEGEKKASVINYMSNFIIFSNCMCVLSEDLKTVLILNDTSIAKHYLKLFDKSIEKCKPLVKETISPDEALLNLKKNQEENKFGYECWIEYQPCFGQYYTAELIDKKLKTEGIENRDYLYQLACERFDYMRNLKYSIGIFSENGLKHFVDTGEILDLWSSYVIPFNTFEILEILKQLYDDNLNNIRHDYIANNDNLKIPKSIFVEILKNRVIFSGYSINPERYIFLEIKETSICNEFNDFIHDISNALSLVFSKSKTLEIIKKHIDDLEEKISKLS